MKLAIKCLNSSLLLFTLTAHADLADIGRIYHSTPSLSQLEICQGGGCLKPTLTSIKAEEWQVVATLFAYPSENAQQERERIAIAIGQLETIVGEKIGTSHDKAGTFSHEAGQQEIATGQIYAVDSWFYDNGHPAVVVPFDVWKHNYRPTDSPLNH